MSTRPAIAAPLALPGIRHGFFTREGGVSSGVYASLNCGIGSKDDRALVLENRARVTTVLGARADRLATPYQVHGTTAVTVTEVWDPGQGPQADAVVTNVPGIVLGVGSADCGPILLADGEAGVIGAAHSGWRGALAGVGESVIAAMEALGADRRRIVAALGPTISQANYEVGADVRLQFVSRDENDARFFAPSGRDAHYQFDLPGLIVARLLAARVAASSVGLCTYADAVRFFSYRRTTHRKEPDYGRQLSVIMLAA
ncbi:MAG TPA: peptidoglycan editing factor PgeF [Bauldia sp.]|nr:peptidoglycan editing factor PgeF [Bauldia sp.]